MSDDRFSRQIRFTRFGPAGQEQLARTTVVVVGLGGLGSWIAEHLVRAGVGAARLIDRDLVEESNLPRQALYTAADARAGRPKAEAAAERLAAIGSPTRITPLVRELNARTADELLAGAELVLDGLDHYAGRFLLNDWCRKHRVPWVHGGAVGSHGSVLLIPPAGTPCLRCLFPDADGIVGGETCETVGVLSPLPAVIAALQCSEALRWIAGDRRAPRLLHLDVWDGRVTALAVGTPSASCPCCAQERYPALDVAAHDAAARLCGSATVQVQVPGGRAGELDLDRMAARWRGLGDVEVGRWFVRLRTPEWILTLFRDGRALLQGVDSVERGQALYDRFVGS